jgi:hypothetical protein
MSQPVLLTTATKSVRIGFQFSPPNHIYLHREKKYDRCSGAVAVEKLAIVVDASTLVYPTARSHKSKAGLSGASAWRS